MRVLHTNFLRGWGGQSNRILTECVGLAAGGWEILLSVPPDSQLAKRARNSGLQTDETIHYRGGLRLQFLRDVLRMRRLLAEFAPDIIHLHGGKDSWTVAAALVGLKLQKWPLIIRTKHNVFPIVDHPLNKWQYGRFFESIICLSAAGIEQLEEKPYIDPAKLTTIPSAIDSERFAVAPGTRERIRAEFGFTSEHQVIAMTGRLRPEKGHDILFEAIPRVTAARPEVRFLLLGAGSMRDDLAADLAKQGSSGYVILAGFREDIPECLSAADLYVQPSRSEGLGTSVIEASAAGLPIVATRTGGIPDVIDDGKTGLLVNPESPVALADALLRLLSDVDLRSRLAAAARERAHRLFGIPGLVSSTDRLYRHLLATNRP